MKVLKSSKNADSEPRKQLAALFDSLISLMLECFCESK